LRQEVALVPRINAPTVEEHRARQEEAIFTVVGELVAEGGPEAVDLTTVARRVGMARTSLYRYAADADELLGRWLVWVLEPAANESRARLTGKGDARQRLERWLDLVLDQAATTPELAVAAQLASVEGTLPAATRRILEGHADDTQEVLSATVAEALRPRRGRDVESVVAIVEGLAAGIRRAVGEGLSVRTVRNEARRALSGLLPAA
jgi:AcrR family transcriptional regulator